MAPGEPPMTQWPWPAPADDGGARQLVSGLTLPNIALASTAGDEVNLSNVVGLAIVYIYTWTGRPGLSNPPSWDDIPGAHGSTPEAEGFRDLYDEFAALGAQVFGLSAQDEPHQREFAERLALPFPILSDAELRFADALALPRFETGRITYLKRLTVVACDGRIEKVFYPVHPPDTHAAELLVLLKSYPVSRVFA